MTAKNNLNDAERAIYEEARRVLLKNRKTVRTKRGTFGFTCPAVSLYPWQWLWDSCFHAIALRRFDPDFAKGELLSLLSGQWEDGRLPNMVHVGNNWRFDRVVHGTGRDTSGITQPPLVADAVLRCHETARDPSFLKAAYPSLKRYYDWLHRERDADGDGLIAIYHPWESGIDNSPRWDDIFNIRKFNRKAFDLTKGLLMFRFNLVRYDNARMRKVSPFFVKGVDTNSYYRFNLLALARIAGELGREDEAAEFRERSEKTREAMEEKLWDPGLEAYCDLVGTKDGPRRSFVPTPFSFLPLWAGVAKGDRAQKILSSVLDRNAFWLEWPIATVSRRHAAFDPEGYWRGTVWMNVNWLMAETLAKAGLPDAAEELKEKSLKLVEKSGFREYYNPTTGEGLGAVDFSWSTLVIDLLHRDFRQEAENSAV